MMSIYGPDGLLVLEFNTTINNYNLVVKDDGEVDGPIDGEPVWGLHIVCV